MPKGIFVVARPTNRITDELRVVGTKRLAPTPDILDALEKDYPIEASLADLIDNSIDAHARRVLIRFGMRGRHLVNLCLADDGWGMDESTIDDAMQFGKRRKYRPDDLGMFGVGLKTASLSHADMVTVVSKARAGAAVGRQWTKGGIKEKDWSVNVISGESATKVLSRDWGVLGQIRRGTIVRWDQVTDFDRLRSGVDQYLEHLKVLIQNHLGLKLHRFLERRAIGILIDVQDLATGEVSLSSKVTPMNPFPSASAAACHGYPKDFFATVPALGKLTLRAHIWRKKSKDDGYRLGGGKVAEHQGFYFYRHGRLIQDGGWSGLIGTNEPHLSLARVEVDIPDALAGYLKVRNNKAGVDVPVTFSESILTAVAKDGTDFRGFLAAAKEEYRRRGELQARPMLRPGDGLPADVKTALQDLDTPFIRGKALSLRWDRVSSDHLFRVDHARREVILNARLRKHLLGDSRGSKTDLPLVRTLLYFALEALLSGKRIGKVEGLRLKAIQEATAAAVKTEFRWARQDG